MRILRNRFVWTLVAAIGAGLLGAAVQLFWESDAVLAALIAGGTVAYAAFTWSLVETSRSQVEASRQQALASERHVEELIGQRAEEREWEKQRADDADHAQQVAQKATTESVKARLDARAPSCTVTFSRAFLGAKRRQDGKWVGVQPPNRTLQRELDPWRFQAEIEFEIENFGTEIAAFFVAHPVAPADFVLEHDLEGNLPSRTLLIGPGHKRGLYWRFDASGSNWWNWCVNGRGSPEPLGNPWMLEFSFQTQTASVAVVDDHVWRAELRPFQIEGSELCRSQEGMVVNGWAFAVRKRSYPGLDEVK